MSVDEQGVDLAKAVLADGRARFGRALSDSELEAAAELFLAAARALLAARSPRRRRRSAETAPR